MRRITTFRSATDRMYDNGPIRLRYYNILLTSCCRVLLGKLTGLQLVKKFPAFPGTPRFITALTSVRHLSLSWASPIQSIYPHTTSWRSFLILYTHLHLGLPIGLFPALNKEIKKQVTSSWSLFIQLSFIYSSFILFRILCHQPSRHNYIQLITNFKFMATGIWLRRWTRMVDPRSQIRTVCGILQGPLVTKLYAR